MKYAIFFLAAFFHAQAGIAADKGRCGLWIDMYRGEPVDYEEMLADLLASKLIYLGETHTLARHHEMERRILADICSAGKKTLLCLEQIEARHQSGLDVYNRGSLDFEGLAEAVDWPSSWSNYLDYRGILETARECGAISIALNAPREIISKIGRTGLSSLSPNERSTLPDRIDMRDLPYRSHLGELLSVHSFASQERLEFLIEAQIARDETMAAELWKRMKKSETADGLYVVIGGASHFSYGLGVPSRVRREVPGVRDRIVLFSESGDLRLTEREKMVARGVRRTHEDLRSIRLPIADYIYAVSLQR